MDTERCTERIVRTPDTLGGRPRIAGHRIAVDDVVGWLNSGMEPHQICEEYGIHEEDIRACVCWAIGFVDDLMRRLEEEFDVDHPYPLRAIAQEWGQTEEQLLAIFFTQGRDRLRSQLRRWEPIAR